jgi:hypothetical protein
MEGENVIKTIIVSASLAFGFVGAANAGMMPAPVGVGASAIVKVAEGCGPGFWRGPHGHCHPMAMGRECPRGYHLGPEGHRCWPNE